MPAYQLYGPLQKIGNEIQSVNELIKAINITTESGSLYDGALTSTLTALYRHDGQKTIGNGQ